MQSVNILIQALDQYEGTFVVISHDRYFVENVANKIWYIDDYQLKEYPGTYHEYEYFMEQRDKEDRKNNNKPEKPAPKPVVEDKPKVNQAQNGTLQTDLKRLNGKLKQVEQEVQNLERELATYEKELADPKVYSNVAILKDTTVKFEAAKKALDAKNSEWENLMESIDEMETKIKAN